MTVEIAFGGSETATNDPEAACDNLLEVLLLIALNMEVFYGFLLFLLLLLHIPG